MAASVQRCTGLVGTMGLATIVPAPAAGKVHRVDLTACNVTNPAGYAGAYVYVKDNTNPANSHYRKSAHPVPAPPDDGCTVILEYAFTLSAGQELQIKATAVDAVSFSAEYIEGDANA